MDHTINRNFINVIAASIGALISAYICLPYSKDGEAYLYIYEVISSEMEVEYLFRLILQFGNVLNVEFTSILLPLIFFTLLLKLKAFKEFGATSSYTYIAYISFFYLLHDCSQYRISAALAFALWSCVSVMQRNWTLAVLLGVFSIGFHITAILLPIVFAICYHFQIIRKFSWIFLVVGVFIYLLKIPIMGFATMQITNLLGGRYLEYTGGITENQNTSGLAFVYASLLTCTLIVIHYWGRFKLKTLPSAYPAMLATSVYGCATLFWLYETVAVASRLSDVFLILIIPLLGTIIGRLGLPFRGVALMLLSVLFGLKLFQLFLY
jgi:EpsG family